ncbi:hypothetical protein LXA43DRAFT_749717 [Ganoderma leucocontextum]|nr:hypothetical protein LXA43DRAFT_749717 [Ganoderma leucocontextum]
MGDHPIGTARGPLNRTREALEILPVLLYGKLPTLQTFRLSAMNRKSLPLSLHPSFFPSLAQFRTVTMLALYHVTFARSADFVRTVASLASLKTLECGHVQWLAQDGHFFDTLGISHLSLEGANYYPETSPNTRARSVISLLSATRLQTLPWIVVNSRVPPLQEDYYPTVFSHRVRNYVYYA